MHELSIARAIVDVARRHADGGRVVKIEVSVGHLRQVLPASLQFAFELVSVGTTAEGAMLVIEQVPACGRCQRCACESVLERFPLCCAQCGSPEVDLIAGEELSVQALEVEMEAMANERIGGASHT